MREWRFLFPFFSILLALVAESTGMITKTEAVVLKAMKYRDTSKIVTFYTRKFGKLKGIAKGARQLRNKFGSSLDPLSRVALVFYKKEQRELHLISQCDLLGASKGIRSDLEKMATGLAVLELVDQLSHEEENEPLFLLLSETLERIETAGKNVTNLFYAFALRCSALLGFMPDVESCSSCRKTLSSLEGDRSALFRLSSGGILCSACAGDVRTARNGAQIRVTGHRDFAPSRDEGRIRMTIPAVKALSFLLHAPLVNVTALSLAPAAGNEIDGTLRLYLRQHFESMRPVKALDLLKKFEIARS